MKFAADAAGDAGDYSPTAIADFRRIISHAGAVPAGMTFVDLGCGAGRVLVMAAMAGFSRVMGVEADPGLVTLARRNVERWQDRHSCGALIEVVAQDARDFRYPDRDLFVYLYSPFLGAIFDAVLRRLVERGRRPGTLIIAYNSNELADRIDATGQFGRRNVRPLLPWRRPTMSIHRSLG